MGVNYPYSERKGGYRGCILFHFHQYHVINRNRKIWKPIAFDPYATVVALPQNFT